MVVEGGGDDSKLGDTLSKYNNIFKAVIFTSVTIDGVIVSIRIIVQIAIRFVLAFFFSLLSRRYLVLYCLILYITSRTSFIEDPNK